MDAEDEYKRLVHDDEREAFLEGYVKAKKEILG